MGKRFRELILLLAACAVVLCNPTNKTAKKDAKDAENFIYQDEDYDGNDDQDQVLFSEDRPCPRDCICSVSQGYRIAKCNRLEVGTQKFGDDITDLVIEHADSSNPIQLDEFIFKKLGLHQIATVKIVNSTITAISPQAFHGLTELYAVNLSNNKLRSLHPETFANNKKLLLLTLSNNPLKFPSEDYFLNASSVQELDVSYCKMEYITTHTFKKMPGLMYLNVAGNNISELHPDSFKKLLDLEEIDLSDNNIKSLPDDIFSENTELATLHIQKNPIDTVYGLQISDLLTLNVGQTNIKFIGPSMFNGMTYLANLNLSGNSIEKIHNQAFHKLVELNYLDLSYNDLDFISNILIKENIELDIFKISNNPRLKHLPEEGFACSADQFNIYLFDASNCGLEEIYNNTLKTFSDLTQINLSNNQIKSITPQVFSRCTKLVEINLAYNMLTVLDVKIFENNNELGRLNLQGNPLKVLSADIFTHTPALIWLDVSHAELNSLWKVDRNGQSKLLNNLSFLNVSHNRINEIKQTELDTLEKLRTFDITYNPLVCNREFENLISLLSKRKVSPNANSASIANLAKDAKEDDNPQAYSWEFLSSKTCGNAIPLAHPVEPLPVSDEEIWERIDKEAEGNFDLKETLDDGKIPDDNKLTVSNIPTKINVVIDDADNDKDDDDEDDKDNAEEVEDEAEDEEDDADAGEDYEDGDDDIDLKVKFEKPASKVQNKITDNDNVELKIKLLEKDSLYDELQAEYVQTTESPHSRYGYLWPILIAILAALLLLIVVAKVVMLLCTRRGHHIRIENAIIKHPSRIKTNCGLVYQPLSEDLAGPKTPKLNRYTPLPQHNVTLNTTNLSYEISPFHHSNIVPEAV